jgi:predicted phage terminase large subunit-like protein
MASRGLWTPAPHLAMLTRELLEVAAGRTRRLVISMPPRHGKSELVSRYFPAWWLGSRPNDRIILASYEASFAATWGAKARDVLREFGPSIFGVEVRSDARASDRWDLAPPHAGGMVAVGEGGSLTGRGANLLIVDDLVKNAEEASSKAHREHAWDWWRSTARTRLEPGGAVVVVGTRWHEDDVIGRLIREGQEDGEPFRVINLPAVAEENDQLGRKPGEALWPERFDVAALEKTKREVGSYVWAAMYQGRPAPLEGGLFKRAWFRHEDPPPFESLIRFATVDLAASTKASADFTVVLVAGLDMRGRVHILDVDRRRLEGPQLIPAIKHAVDRWKLSIVGIEKVAFQLALIQQARAAGIYVRELEADRDKVARALMASAALEAGDVLFPKSAHWLGELEAELLGFPNSTHDDQVDALCYAIAMRSTLGAATWWNGAPVTPAQTERQRPMLFSDNDRPMFPAERPAASSTFPWKGLNRPSSWA